MRKLLNVSLLLTVLFLAACEKQETESLISNEKTTTIAVDGVTVKDGILCFKDESSIAALKEVLKGKEYDDLAVWEESISFKSIERASSEVMDGIFCRAEQLVASGLTQKEVLQKFDNGEIQEVTDDAQQKIAELKLVYKKDKNNLRYMDYSFTSPFANRFLNEKYEVVVADTLYRYSSDKIEIYPAFSKGGMNDEAGKIVAYRSKIKSDQMLKDVTLGNHSAQLCYDKVIVGDHKLSVNFTIERVIYQKSGCTTNCTRTKAYAYINYQGYYYSWFSWHEGTYIVDGAVAFDVQFGHADGTTEFVGRMTPSYNVSTSPIVVYSVDDLINSDYPWIGIGNVDCGIVSMGTNISCVFNQNQGLYGENEQDGYLPIHQLLNSL